jgi:hypothetical protein
MFLKVTTIRGAVSLDGYAYGVNGIVSSRHRASRMGGGRLGSPFTAREVYRNDWTGLAEPRLVGRLPTGARAGFGQKRSPLGMVVGPPSWLRNRQSVPWAMSFCGFDLIIPTSCVSLLWWFGRGPDRDRESRHSVPPTSGAGQNSLTRNASIAALSISRS